MKLIKDEYEGKKVWLQRQYLYRPGGWSVKIYSIELVEFHSSFPKKLEPEWPTISESEEDVAKILQEWGYVLTREGRSGFKNRNKLIVEKKNSKTIEIEAPLLISGTLSPEQKKQVGLKPILTTGEDYLVDTEKEYVGKIIAKEEIEEVEEAIDKAFKEARDRYEKKFIDAFLKASKDGISAIIRVGGYEELSYWRIPKRFVVLGQKIVSYTQDLRQERSHTYDIILLDKEKIDGKKYIEIEIPDEYKGIVIGKGGGNIKKIGRELNCFIKVK